MGPAAEQRAAEATAEEADQDASSGEEAASTSDREDMAYTPCYRWSEENAGQEPAKAAAAEGEGQAHSEEAQEDWKIGIM